MVSNIHRTKRAGWPAASSLTVLTVLLLVSTALGSCRSGAERTPELPAETTTEATVFAQMPAVGTLDRLVSDLQDYTQLGREAIAQSEGAVVDGDNLIVAAAEGEMEWAIWRLGPVLDRGRALRLAMELTNEQPGPVWFAIADYDTQQWRFYGEHWAPIEFNLDEDGGPKSLDHPTWCLSPLRHVYVAVVAWDGKSGAVETAQLDTEIIPLPEADLKVLPERPEPGSPVLLDGSKSRLRTVGWGPQTEIVAYQWDLDGDGIHEIDTGLEPTCMTTLPDPAGTVEVGLKVIDNLGGAGTAFESLTSPYIGWIVKKIDSDGAGNYYDDSVSLEVIGGHPAIAYGTGNSSGAPVGIRFWRSASIDGLEEWESNTIYDAELSQTSVSLVEIAGTPAICHLSKAASYFDPGELRFTRSVLPDGSGDWDSMLIEQNAIVAGSLMLVEGRPSVAFARTGTASQEDICFSISIESDGAGEWTTYTPALETPVWTLSSAVVGGHPAIVSNPGGANGELTYLYSIESDGSGDWNAVTVTNEQQWLCYLIDWNNLPIVGYFSGDGFSSYFDIAIGENAEGDGTWITQRTSPNGVNAVSLAEIAGLPAVAYMHNGDMQGLSKSLRLMRTTEPLGSSEWTSSSAEDWIGGNYSPSLKEVDGRPAVAFGHYGKLMFAVLYE